MPSTSPRRHDNVMRKLILGFVIGLAALVGSATAAHAVQIDYVSPHPVPHKFGGGFCNINVLHTHNYSPGEPRMYRQEHGQHYFVGDPAPFGYDGPRYAYYGAHPVMEAELRFGHPVFCYLKGPHSHWYQPTAQAQFQLSGGAYWYVGAFPQAYYDERPRYAVINDAYAPVVYTRPVVDVAVAPPMVAASISFGGPGWHAHAVVGGPPVPVMVAPPPPGPPIQIGVGINVGGPVVVPAPGPPGYYRHDHGRHAGWEKHHGRPSRFIVGPAPVQGPVFEHRRGHQPVLRGTPGPQPRPAMRGHAPAPAPMRGHAPVPGPMRGSAPAQGHNDNRGRHR